jgi:prenyltransferase beta subunit
MLRSLGIAALAALAIAAPAQAGTVSYVRGAQNADGGFGMTQSGGSSQLATGWALLGLNATGQRPGPAALAYIRRGLGGLREIGDVERTVLVVRAAGQNPRRFGGRNLISDILRHRRRDGSFDGFVSYTSFAIFALRRSGVSRTSGTIRSAARWLERHQNADGGFNVGGRGASAIDDTGYAAQALVVAGRRGAALRRAATFLARSQSSNGGFPLSRGGAPNAQSTAYAVQGLVAAGGHSSAVRRGQAYLRSLTEPNGLVRYSRTSRQTPVWVSAQALMALNRRTF